VEAGSLRQTASPRALLRQALGGPRQLSGKLRRLFRTARLWLDGAELERRLGTLRDKGLIQGRPSRAQLFFGGLDMMRFVVEPAARQYYEERGISFGFHQVLRVLDDPTSMIDPTGLFSERDTIIGHVMQVVHFHPVYDLQLMEMWPDGLEDFEGQVQQMVDGTHPRHGSIGAIVEEPGYHARLLDYVRRYRCDPNTPELVRQQSAPGGSPRFAAAERTFATLPGFVEYCLQLPRGGGALLRRLVRVKEFPVELAGRAAHPE
jgi:hypothetical protein